MTGHLSARLGLSLVLNLVLLLLVVHLVGMHLRRAPGGFCDFDFQEILLLYRTQLARHLCKGELLSVQIVVLSTFMPVRDT